MEGRYDPFSTIAWSVAMGILASIGSWLVGKLFNVKTLATLIVLLALGYCQYRFYDWAFTRGDVHGVASQKKTIDGLTKDLTTTKATLAKTQTALDGWISKYNQYVKDATKQVTDLQSAYAATQATYTKQLGDLQATLAKTQQELSNATSTYITSVGNAGCTVPTGFVQLYNLSLQEGTAYAGPTSAASLALAGTSFSAYDAPSGLSLSDVARVIVVNNNAAVANRALVLGWQNWYAGVKSDYEKYLQSHPQAPAAPSVTLLTPPEDVNAHVTDHPHDPFLAQVQSWGVRSPVVDAR